jgi:hypothetical protein
MTDELETLRDVREALECAKQYDGHFDRRDRQEVSQAIANLDRLIAEVEAA